MKTNPRKSSLRLFTTTARKPKGHYTRIYLGGPLDGRTDNVPLHNRSTVLPAFVNKQSWESAFHGSGFKLVEANNYYVLREPGKAQFGGSYIYEYDASYVPVQPVKEGVLVCQ